MVAQGESIILEEDIDENYEPTEEGNSFFDTYLTQIPRNP